MTLFKAFMKMQRCCLVESGEENTNPYRTPKKGLELSGLLPVLVLKFLGFFPAGSTHKFKTSAHFKSILC